jgi:hypothetical protein
MDKTTKTGTGLSQPLEGGPKSVAPLVSNVEIKRRAPPTWAKRQQGLSRFARTLEDGRLMCYQ